MSEEEKGIGFNGETAGYLEIKENTTPDFCSLENCKKEKCGKWVQLPTDKNEKGELILEGMCYYQADIKVKNFIANQLGGVAQGLNNKKLIRAMIMEVMQGIRVVKQGGNVPPLVTPFNRRN